MQCGCYSSRCLQRRSKCQDFDRTLYSRAALKRCDRLPHAFSEASKRGNGRFGLGFIKRDHAAVEVLDETV